LAAAAASLVNPGTHGQVAAVNGRS
jgi:hypothetical protein